jgi:hypothetical protein
MRLNDPVKRLDNVIDACGFSADTPDASDANPIVLILYDAIHYWESRNIVQIVIMPNPPSSPFRSTYVQYSVSYSHPSPAISPYCLSNRTKTGVEESALAVFSKTRARSCIDASQIINRDTHLRSTKLAWRPEHQEP